MFEDERKGQLDIEALEKARAEGKRIGLVMGSFDQCHLGHIRYLKRAKEECDYLIVGVDSDAKIRKRKGANRPLIPQEERLDTIMELGVNKVKTYEPGKSLADDIVYKQIDEKKWELIKLVKPDVLVAIPENYTMEDIDKLTNAYNVGRVAVFGRQAETSSSNKLRKILMANFADKVDGYKEMLDSSIEETRKRLNLNRKKKEPFPFMNEHLANSTDWVVPVVAAAKVGDKWYYGTNQCDYTIPKKDLRERTELFYATVEHAEINLLKRIGEAGDFDTIYVSLFPCDRCLKVLIDKGIKKVYYMEDHPDKNWSKRSHELAEKNGVEVICVSKPEKVDKQVEEVNYDNYKYIYPPNVRHQEQLDIMIDNDYNDVDPLDPNVLANEVLFDTKYWHVSINKFPYEGAELHFLISALDKVYDMRDMNDEMKLEIFDILEKLRDVYNIEGGALCYRFGDCGRSGASLKRVHLHVIMPEPEKKVRFPVGGHKILKKSLVIKSREELGL